MKYNEIRLKRKIVRIGNIRIGGNYPIAVQSMTNTAAGDHDAALRQALRLEEAGCDILRIAVPNAEAVRTIEVLKNGGIKMPLVADIHFDYRLAVQCAERGADKIRINPGNIGPEENVKAVCDACRRKNIPIRIGVNGGSLEKRILAKYGGPVPEALCESALYHASLLRKFDFDDIVISIKSSDVKQMTDANVMLAAKCDYPLHLGVTEAGAGERSLLKSAAGIGGLICRGIGDTLRISMTDDPVREVKLAKELLTALNIEGQSGLNIVCCPTCGRTCVDLISLYEKFLKRAEEENLTDIPATVALMGCEVNGPGEAREADFGIAGGKKEALFFRKGVPCGKIPEDGVTEVLIGELRRYGRNYGEKSV